MSSIEERVYLARNNAIDLELREDGVAVDLSAVTRVRLELFDQADADADPIVADSNDTPGILDLTDGASGMLRLVLGAVLSSAGSYRARLVLYDDVNTDGLVWTHELTSGCAGTDLTIRVLTAADAA